MGASCIATSLCRRDVYVDLTCAARITHTTNTHHCTTHPATCHHYPTRVRSVTLVVGRQCPKPLRRSNWCQSDFNLLALLYNGNISSVYHAVDRQSGISVALKLYKRCKLTRIQRSQVVREIRLHSGLSHESVISMYAAWKDKHYVYLALEWAPGVGADGWGWGCGRTLGGGGKRRRNGWGVGKWVPRRVGENECLWEGVVCVQG